jgi:hypothetical protein
MQEEKSNIEPDDLLNAFDQVDEWLEEIQKQEDEALNKIFLRFCLLKGKAIDFDQVRRKRYPANPNFWEYYYRPGTPEQFFLMSRELIVDLGNNGVERHLRISFSRELLKED